MLACRAGACAGRRPTGRSCALDGESPRVTVCFVFAGIDEGRVGDGRDRGAAQRGDRRLRVEEIRRRPIGDVLRREQVVVNLHDDLRAGVEVDARGRREGRRARARHPAADRAACRRRPCRRSRSSPRPASAASLAWTAASLSEVTENSSTWWTVAVEPGWMLKPMRSCAAASAGIDERAVIVVREHVVRVIVGARIERRARRAEVGAEVRRRRRRVGGIARGRALLPTRRRSIAICSCA